MKEVRVALYFALLGGLFAWSLLLLWQMPQSPVERPTDRQNKLFGGIDLAYRDQNVLRTLSSGNTLIEAVANDIATIAIPSSGRLGGTLLYTVKAIGPDGLQFANGIAVFSALEGTCWLEEVFRSGRGTRGKGNLAVGVTCTGGYDSITLQLNPISSLQQESLTVYYEIRMQDAQPVPPQ